MESTQDLTIHPGTVVGHVALTVSSLAHALRFYQDTLGLGVQRQRTGAAWLGVDGERPLVVLTERRNGRPKPQHTTGLYHFAILLPNRGELARVLQRLVARGYPLQGAADHGVSEALYLADADGNGIEIYVDRPKTEWPWQGDRLQMFTQPLDVNGLLQQSDGRWDGMPRGTRIGHIHLHIAELDRAEEFYVGLLRFDLMQRYGSSALFLSAGGYHHHIGLNTWAGVGAPAPPADALGLDHFAVLLDGMELERVVERLTTAGVPFERLSEAKAGPSPVLTRDPAGNRILLDVAHLVIPGFV